MQRRGGTTSTSESPSLESLSARTSEFVGASETRGGCAASQNLHSDARHVLHVCRHGNKYYENMNETLWRHRWVDYASVRAPFPPPPLLFRGGSREQLTDFGANISFGTPQHDYNASQISSEWHAWMQHTRHEPPTSDIVLQQAKKPWQIVRFGSLHGLLSPGGASRRQSRLPVADSMRLVFLAMHSPTLRT